MALWRVTFITRRDPSATRRQRHSDALSVDSCGPVVGLHHHHYGAPTVDVHRGLLIGNQLKVYFWSLTATHSYQWNSHEVFAAVFGGDLTFKFSNENCTYCARYKFIVFWIFFNCSRSQPLQTERPTAAGGLWWYGPDQPYRTSIRSDVLLHRRVKGWFWMLDARRIEGSCAVNDCQLLGLHNPLVQFTCTHFSQSS